MSIFKKLMLKLIFLLVVIGSLLIFEFFFWAGQNFFWEAIASPDDCPLIPPKVIMNVHCGQKNQSKIPISITWFYFHLFYTNLNLATYFISDAQNMVSLVGPAEKFVQLGSTITLTCHVKFNSSSNETNQRLSVFRKPVQWFHFANLISIQVSVKATITSTGY